MSFFGGATCPVMGAVFKTVCGVARVSSRWVRLPHASAKLVNSEQVIVNRNMIDWIALNMTPGVGPRAATKLLERFGSADAVFHARRTELESLRLKPETTDSIIKHEFHEKAEKELERVKAAWRRCFNS